MAGDGGGGRPRARERLAQGGVYNAAMEATADFLIIGAGIIGVTLALELRRRHAAARIVLIDKEERPGLHASGRNSGVLHAGFYYTADSLKARYCRDGNRALTEYCLERGLPINRCGKLVVARDASELDRLEELLRRGRANDVPVQGISAAEARAIEPRAKTCERALWSPTTASVDPVRVMTSLTADAERAGIRVLCATGYMGRSPRGIRTNQGEMRAGYVINAAGLYADRLARDFGYAREHRILPFKGLYLYSSEEPGALRTQIYPVPDLRNPFLGVHFTVTVDARVKIGPTAIPAFWREHYEGVERFRLRELAEILSLQARLMVNSRFGFARLALQEFPKYWRRRLVRLAAELVDGVRVDQYRKWGSPGLRAQLVNVRERRLAMDFLYEGDDRSFHVLNAVSPAFTCSIPFSRHLADEIQRLRR
ncbi:MAG: L-2-hydroxyglutarate oxidase LhgO [Gammaproteobacteria bacterium]|nr:L-2-hydroxyglutarate oxidase LhgO [Gammaproteobacteria bacterium]